MASQPVNDRRVIGFDVLVKHSGLGVDLGQAGLEEFTHPHIINIAKN